MSRRASLVIVWLMACGGAARCEIVIPEGKRLPCSVVARISATGDKAMHLPTDVAVDGRGRVFVADGAADRVVRFSPEGRFESEITEVGGEALCRPVGLTIGQGDELWIADTGNHRLVVVAPDGKPVRSLKLPKSSSDRATDPTDVGLSPGDKRLYVVDNDNHRVLACDPAEEVWTALGREGRSLGQFEWPFMICAGPNGYVCVTEALGARVQRISPTDRWAGQVGRWGVEVGQLFRPKGVAMDADSRLFVSDSTLGVVQVFATDARLVGVLTDGQGAPVRFVHPMGMCFDKAGRLYVVELEANRVAVVSLGGGASPSGGAGGAGQGGKGAAR
ncbi:MAG: NHL repeat-containing protein [Phycisphaerae bacterium]|nr:NHL repeat-containing protein [Phycisphaerae bacterium]